MKKSYKLPSEKIKNLIESTMGCIASDMITVNGELVGYMYREDAQDSYDSGWRFFSGKEDQDYADDANNFAFYKINTIANYDQAIIPYINYPNGTSLVRVAGGNEFEIES